MHRTERTSGTAAATAIILVGVAVAMAWIAFSGSLSGVSVPDFDGPLARAEIQEAVASPLIEGMRIESSIQFSQPRDPFRPLITEDSAGAPGGGTGTNGDGTGVGTSVTLQEIRDVDGVLRATVIVDGVSYDVGIGDQFAGRFMVVSLDSDSGVFLNGDNAFSLSVGQQILK